MILYRSQGILPSGQEIAVKRLAGGSGQGELEFKNEVLLLTRLQHRNLVKLLGFCNEGNEEILVYEHVPNSSLDHFIFGKPLHDQCTQNLLIRLKSSFKICRRRQTLASYMGCEVQNHRRSCKRASLSP